MVAESRGALALSDAVQQVDKPLWEFWGNLAFRALVGVGI